MVHIPHPQKNTSHIDVHRLRSFTHLNVTHPNGLIAPWSSAKTLIPNKVTFQELEIFWGGEEERTKFSP